MIYNNSCGCNARDYDDCGCGNIGGVSDNGCGCGNVGGVSDNGCGCGNVGGCDNRGVLGCAACGLVSTVFRVIRGLDNSLGSCGCGNGCGSNNGCGCNNRNNDCGCR
jgi:hypothetical protein